MTSNENITKQADATKAQKRTLLVAYIFTIFFYAFLFAQLNIACYVWFSELMDRGIAVLATACISVLSSIIFAEFIVHRLSKELFHERD